MLPKRKRYRKNAVKYSITYDLSGGSVSSNPSEYTIESSAITLNNPTKTGYTFTGWTGTGLSSSNKSVTIPKGSTGNRSYTANWKASTYTITYNANGGSGAPSSHTESVGVSINLSNTIPTRNITSVCNSHSNYVFLGWSTDSGATSASYSPGDSFKNDSSSNITLYYD